ncbi:MAG TPA: hypothetical protein VMW27_11040 [Thermoanaerobaculia bacterium]|nr:hypothetical protein [Thermoanaerobaculia bacterium]
MECEHAGEALHYERSLAGGVELYYLRINSPRGESIFHDREDSNFDNRANRSFFARVYKPVVKANHAVIIYNGLDETIFTQEPDELFEFYDNLGEQLAQVSILAILLPTPYHMNRALAYVDAQAEAARREYDKSIDYTIPTEALMERNWNIYRNHFQGFKETVELCRCLRPDLSEKAWLALEDPAALPPKSAKFLQEAVSPLVKISLLGYSLGGLRALTEYLFDRHDAKIQQREPMFTACVAVNSGGALTVLPNPPWVDSQRWRSMIEDLLGQRFTEDQSKKTLRGIREDQHKQAERYYTFLNDVFLGQASSLNVLGDAAAREAANGMLFVIGGSDNLVPLESIKRFAPAGGVTILQVAGMGHLFPYDPAWRLWKGVVLDVISKFLDNTARTLGVRSDYDSLVDLICLVDNKLGILPYRSNVEDFATLRQARERMTRIDNACDRVLGGDWKQIFPVTQLPEADIEQHFRAYVESLMDRLHLAVRRGAVHPSLYKRRRRALLLGRFLTNGYAPLQDAWGGLQRESDEMIGETLVRMGVVSSGNRDAALAEQKRSFDAIRKLMEQEFSIYLRSEKSRPVGASRA